MNTQLNKSFSQKLTEISASEESLMQLVTAVIQWNDERHQRGNTSTKGLWKGHNDFMKNVSAFYIGKNYLSQKQRDSLVRTLSKYERIVEPIIDSFEENDTLDTNDVDGSLELIFDQDDFDGQCPNCESSELTALPIDTELHANVWKCEDCDCISKYIVSKKTAPVRNCTEVNLISGDVAIITTSDDNWEPS